MRLPWAAAESGKEGATMETLLERCAGLGVHKDTVVATVRVPGEAGGRRIETQSFNHNP